jgi:hypothetical protein
VRLSLQVTAITLHDDGTSTVWLRWLVVEPGTHYFPSIPATCDHQNVNVGDWWELALTSAKQEG